MLSKERGVGHRGALEALEVLSGSQREEDEERHSQVGAWEEALSYLVAQGGLRERGRASERDKSFTLD